MAHQTVLVVDFGGQYTQLIVRRVREAGVYSEMVSWTKAAQAIEEKEPRALILSGGPRSVLEPGAPHLELAPYAGQIPILGICYGHQWISANLGGRVERADDREYGRRALHINQPSSLVGTMEQGQVWMSHGDQVLEVPTGFRVTGETASCPVAAMEDAERRIYGVQFHPEVSHTLSGRAVLQGFLDRAGLTRDWTSQAFIEETVAAIRAEVGEGRVLCATSGGVDSSVAAALLTEALGDQVTCVFVDHGLLRKNEAQEVVDAFTNHFHPRLVVIEAQDQFFSALAGVTDPEQKRKIIGAEFVRSFEQHADELSGCDFLAQGTLYPDVIESGSPTAAKFKTHHNVGGLPDWMRLKVIEPLKWLFKDEVREVGRQLGLPEAMVEREPFPGPGLGVRILGEVTPERVRIVQDADWIFRSELRERGLHKGIWQSYAALLDVRSVGVMGDERTNDYTKW